MSTTFNKTSTVLLSLLLGCSVLLSSAHAKDVAGLSASTKHNQSRKSFGDDTSVIKTAPDLHNHVDKQHASNTLLLDHSIQADARSLRLTHNKKDLSRHFWSHNKLANWFYIARFALGAF